MAKIKVEKLSNYKWRIPKGSVPGMRVDGIFYASERLYKDIQNDNSLLQLANVATLPGIVKYSLAMPDIHWGYGFPIGGVAATDPEEGGIISPGGVGYDVNCLAPDSRVLTEHGYWVKVEDLPERFKLQELKVYDIEEGHNDSSRISLVAERKVESHEIAIRITTENNRIVEGSDDHPVLTPEGYKPLGEIKEGGYLLVYPFEGLEYEEDPEFILTEKDFNGYDTQILRYYRERGLVPLRGSDPRIGTIARLLGFAFGAGSLHLESGKRLILSFYGKGEELEEIRKDLRKLGIKPSKIYTRGRNLHTETAWGRTYEGESGSARIKITSGAFALFMHKLGMPVGKKTEQVYNVPRWIIRAPRWVKRNFLAGFFGANGSIPEFKSYTPLPINLTQSKHADLEGNLLAFLGDIVDLLREFEVESIIYPVKSLRGGVTYRLSIVGEENIKRFLGLINYEYAIEKKVKGLIGYEYLKRKERVRGIRKEAVKKANRIAQSFPTFEEFADKLGYEGGFVADRIVKVEHVKPDYDRFYDVGVYHEAHNFIANGVVVHNCGVRLLRTNLTYDDVRDRIRDLVNALFERIPTGVGSTGSIRLSESEMRNVLKKGARWAVDNGYGRPEDLLYTEENGCLEFADPSAPSRRAYQRGRNQLGTLGSGNHFLEVQLVEKIYDRHAAELLGLEEGMITVMIHTGSRGFGHQVCDDTIKAWSRVPQKYGISIPDRQLVCAPVNSPEGQRYLAAMACAANYAWANRQCLMHWTRQVFQKFFAMSDSQLGMDLVYDVAHNIAKIEKHDLNGKKVTLCVHRKGATRAFPPGHPDIPERYRSIGQPVIIPGDMGTHSYVLVGTELAMKEAFGTTCHGAGRVLSRRQAIRTARGRNIQRELEEQDIYVRSAGRETLAEEMPDAYKDVDEVVNTAHGAGISKRVARMRPLGVIKG
ncbi:RtcB family protein [Candidatus Poribacteria bacterium]|nr:RtcB family protein [Candidatus Poribacteria bacterium]